MVETKGYKVAKGFKFNNDESIWNDMLCYFKCDGSMTDAVQDIELTTLGSPTYGTGKINQSIITSNYNTFNFKIPLKTERQYSFGMWKNFDNFGNDSSWATCLRGQITGHMLIVDKTGSQGSVMELGVFSNGTGNFRGSGILTTDYSGWHWIYVEVDNTSDSNSGETRIYIDNVLEGTCDRAVYDDAGIKGFLCYNLGYQSFGECDEIFIKNGFMTEVQRTQAYNSGAGISLNNTQTFPVNSVSLDKYTGRKVFTDDSSKSYVPTHTHNDSEEGTILSFDQMNMENMFKSLAYINYFQQTNAAINLSTQNYDDVSTADLNGINDTINTSATDAEYDTLGGNDGYISKINFTTYTMNDDNGNIARMVSPIRPYYYFYDYDDNSEDSGGNTRDYNDERYTEQTIITSSGNTETIYVKANVLGAEDSGTTCNRDENFSYYFPLLAEYGNERTFTLTSMTNWTTDNTEVGEAGVVITFDGYTILNKGNGRSGGDNTKGTIVQTIKLVKEGGGNVLLYIDSTLVYTSATGCQTIDFILDSEGNGDLDFDEAGEQRTYGEASVAIQTYNSSQLTQINKPYLENPYGWYSRVKYKTNGYPDEEDRTTENYTITYTDTSIKLDNNVDAYAREDTTEKDYSRTDILHVPLIDGEKRKLFLNTYVYASGDVDSHSYGKATLRIKANTTTFFNIVYSINDYTLSNTQYFYIFAERIGNTINYYMQDGTTLITTHSGTEGLFNIYTYTYERDEDPDGASSAQTHVTFTYPTNGYVDSIVATNSLVSAGTDINYAVVYADYIEDTNTEVTTNIVNGSKRLNDVALGELIDVSDFSGNTNLEFNLKTTDSTKTAKFKKYSVVWY